MLAYNFDRIFKARAISRPFTFLTTHGFSDNLASRIKQNRVRVLRNRELEKLCLILQCTPNDLLEWTDDENVNPEPTHPMRKLMRTGKISDLNKTIHSIPLDKIGEIDQLIHEKLKDYED